MKKPASHLTGLAFQNAMFAVPQKAYERVASAGIVSFMPTVT